MSGAVKKVGKAVKSVVKGIGKVVKKVTSSKVFKVIATAATIYFGGAAIMGALGGASAGSGFMGTLMGAVKGAGAGLSSAMNGISGAWSALTQGEIGGAIGSLGQGVSGAYGAGSGAVSGAASGAASLGGVDGLKVAGDQLAKRPDLLSGGADALMVGGEQLTKRPDMLAGGPDSLMVSGEQLAKRPDMSKGLLSNTGAMQPPNQAQALNFKDMTPDQVKNAIDSGSLTTEQMAEAKKALEAAIGAEKTGLLASVAKNPLTGYGLLQMGGSVIQGYGQEKAMEEEQERRNRNVRDFGYQRRYA